MSVFPGPARNPCLNSQDDILRFEDEPMLDSIVN